MLIAGSNGQEYMFLLKGHEDLRQDERVMQLFGLVNSLLLNNPETFRRNLTWVYIETTGWMRQNGRHFADDILICIFFNENVWISIKISLKFVP